MDDNRGNATDWNWHSYHMMEKAKALYRVADELDRRGTPVNQDQLLFLGKLVAVPVLMALAMEIALKAWQCRERNAEPDKSHDLLKLFESLEEKTKARLQARSLDYLHPTLGPKFPPNCAGLEWMLSSHRKNFEHWRYPYEARGPGTFDTGQFKVTLAVVVIEMYEELARESS